MIENYMLDTNVFSNLVQGRIALSDLPSNKQFWATSVQFEELRQTKDIIRKTELLSLFNEMILDKNTAVSPSFAFDVRGAGFGEGVWRNTPSIGPEFKKDLDMTRQSLPSKKRKSSKKENNIQDAIIAEAARFHDFTLITCDCVLATVAAKHSVKILFLKLTKL